MSQLTTQQAANILRERDRKVARDRNTVSAVDFFEKYGDQLEVMVTVKHSNTTMREHGGMDHALAYIMAEIPADVIQRARVAARAAMEKAVQ